MVCLLSSFDIIIDIILNMQETQYPIDSSSSKEMVNQLLDSIVLENKLDMVLSEKNLNPYFDWLPIQLSNNECNQIVRHLEEKLNCPFGEFAKGFVSGHFYSKVIDEISIKNNPASSNIRKYDFSLHIMEFKLKTEKIILFIVMDSIFNTLEFKLFKDAELANGEFDEIKIDLLKQIMNSISVK